MTEVARHWRRTRRMAVFDIGTGSASNGVGSASPTLMVNVDGRNMPRVKPVGHGREEGAEEAAAQTFALVAIRPARTDLSALTHEC